MIRRAPLRHLSVILLAGAIAFGGCGDGDEGDGSDPGGTTPTSSFAPDSESGTVIELVVIGDELEGGARRESASLGEDVTVRVRGDSTDQIHIHGYDQYVTLSNGEGEVTFPALIPGVFEIELEGSGTLLVQLEVS
jgi:hypothetical protein